jgi:hypothetical protein
MPPLRSKHTLTERYIWQAAALIPLFPSCYLLRSLSRPRTSQDGGLQVHVGTHARRTYVDNVAAPPASHLCIHQSTRWAPTTSNQRPGIGVDADRAEREAQRLRVRVAETEEQLITVRAEATAADDAIGDLRRQMTVIRDVVLSDNGISPRKQDSLRQSLAVLDGLDDPRRAARTRVPRAGKRLSPRKNRGGGGRDPARGRTPIRAA